jgi:hypothetical protein
VGRQIINTKGASRAIARRRIIALVVLVIVAIGVAVTIYLVRKSGHHPAAAVRSGGSAVRTARA